jgi:hypothetical protein
VIPIQGPARIIDRLSASIQTEKTEPNTLRFRITGWLDATSTGDIWRVADREINRMSPQRIVVDTSEMVYCDGSGIGCFGGRLEPGL